MPKYAFFDPTQPEPQRVAGWYDTDAITYASLPDAAHLIELTADEWTAHFASPDGWAVQNGKLVTYTPPGPTLAQAQATQSAAMSAACQEAIEAGFTSSALGAVYSYPSDPTSQRNILLAAQHGGSLWCQSQGGAWGFTTHTIEQATQVAADLTAHIQAEQAHYAARLIAIAAATTVAAVQAVTW